MNISNRLQRFLAGLFLSTSIAALPVGADAMSIQKFEQMDIRDQARYATMLHEKAALSFLDKEHVTKRDIAEADKIRLLFTGPSKDVSSEGMTQFVSYLKQVRTVNPAVDVERVMALVFQKNNINVSQEQLLQLIKDFKPSNQNEESRQSSAK